jgi:hypothetical protein
MANLERLDDRVSGSIGVTDGSQLDEPDSIRAAVEELGRGLQR